MKLSFPTLFSIITSVAAANGIRDTVGSSYVPKHIDPEVCRHLSAEKCQKRDLYALKRKESGKSRALGGLNEGKVKALVLLVRFPDHADRVLPTRQYIQDLCDGNGDKTIKKYFLEQSYGAYEIECDVKDWVTTDNTEAFYAEGKGGQLGADDSAKFFLPVLNQLDHEDFSWLDYDSNEDGILDAVLVVHSGFSSVSEGTNCVNAKKDRIRSQGTSASNAWEDPYWSLELSNYAIASAFTRPCNLDNFAHMGVMTHEWVHSLGSGPIDTYDTSVGNGRLGGLGSFDVMAHPGGYSGSLESPGSMSPFSKKRAGFLTYTDIVEDGVYTIRPSNQLAEVYSITGKFPDGQYLVIENRQKTSFDEQLFGDTGGLLIYYADEKVSRFGTRGFPGQEGWPTNGNHYKFALLANDGNYDLEQGANNGDEGDLWKPGSTLGPGGSFPNTDTYTNGPTGITITDITDKGNGVMSFRVTGLDPSSATESPTQSPVADKTSSPTVDDTTPETDKNASDTSTTTESPAASPTMAPTDVTPEGTGGEQTPSPTPDPRNSCTGVKPGDINMWVLNSEEPDEAVFFAIVNVPASVGKLYITDNAWNGTQLQNIEGTMEYEIPEGGFAPGDTFGMYKDSTDWTNVNSSSFALNPLGDNLFLYCLDGVDNPHFIFGFNYAGEWSEPGLESYGVNQTALPDSLSETGRVAVSQFANWRFDGEDQGQDPEKLRGDFSDNANWIGSELRYDVFPPDETSAAPYFHSIFSLMALGALLMGVLVI